MDCPECGGRYRVEDSIHGVDDDIYRRRKCLSCGKTVYTVETVIDLDGPFRFKYSEALRIKANRGYRRNGV